MERILNKLKYLIDKNYSLSEISSALDMSEYELYSFLLILKQRGYSYDIISGIPTNKAIIASNFDNPVVIESKNKTQICLVSDIHYASCADRLDVIDEIYCICEERGIDTIICAGDLTDGYYPKRSSYNKTQRVYGFNSTKEYVVNNHPFSPYIKFYSISGNHDQTFYELESSSIIGEIAKAREDIKFIGDNMSLVDFNGIKIFVYHGSGKAKSLKEKINKYYQNIPIDQKPDILQLGHIHHSYFDRINNTFIVQCAGLVDQNSYARRLDLPLEISAFFLNISKDGDEIKVDYENKSFSPILKRVK